MKLARQILLNNQEILNKVLKKDEKEKGKKV